MGKIISLLGILFSINLEAQPLDPFKDKKTDFLKMTEHNSKIWAKAFECAKASSNNDQLINCQMELKKDRKSYYQQKREEKKNSAPKAQ